MFAPRLVGTVVAAVIPSSLGLSQATAQKRLTYEQAWKLCIPFARDSGSGGGDQNTRYLRGAACMKRYGHDI